MQALVIGGTKARAAILARPMETPDPTPGADLLPPPIEDDEEGRADPDSPESDAAEPVAPDEVPPEVAPAVVAVLVTSDPGPWLEDALARLAAQDYPALSVLVLDNGSSDDPTPRIAAALPRAFVRRLATNVGFAAAANDALALVEGATFLLFCHDDVVLEPDAVRVMVEEAYRSNAGIVGPKLVDYDHPEVLLEVGMAVDHYGVPFSGIEPGEIDQEQHDARARRLLRLARRRCSSAPTSSTSSAASTPRRSPAPTTSTCAGGRGSPARACSSRPTPAFGTGAPPCRTTRPTRRNAAGRPARHSRAAVCACSPSRTRRSRCSGCCRSRSC